MSKAKQNPGVKPALVVFPWSGLVMGVSIGLLEFSNTSISPLALLANQPGAMSTKMRHATSKNTAL